MRRTFRWRRTIRWTLVVVGGLVLLALVLPHVMNEPLRRHLEARLNSQLDGYTVGLGGAAYRLPVTVELRDAVITQNARPKPPVAQLDSLRISVQWRALLSAAIVADVVIDHPVFHIDRRQAEVEARDPVPLHQRGWQRALEAIYPLKINRLDLRNGEVTYVDQGPLEPVRLTNLTVEADNIRNVRSHAGTYPSPVHARGTLHESAPVTLAGRADFLAEPYAAVQGDFTLHELSLRHVAPLLALYHVTARKGTVSVDGDLEYAPNTKNLHVRRANLKGLIADYVSGTEEPAPTAPPGKKESPVALRVDSLRADGEIGTVDQSANPAYRLFVTKASVDVHDFSSVAADKRTARGRLRGRFMNSGSAAVDTTIRATQPAADFDLAVRLENTDLTTLNDLLQAKGGFDVARGNMSLYSELRVREGRVQGYVKPIFTDVDVYERHQEASDSPLQKAYEGVVGGVATVLRNQLKGQVATQTDLSGPLENPKADPLEIGVQLVRNAFVKAILPGLRGRGGPGGGDGK